MFLTTVSMRSCFRDLEVGASARGSPARGRLARRQEFQRRETREEQIGGRPGRYELFQPGGRRGAMAVRIREGGPLLLIAYERIALARGQVPGEQSVVNPVLLHEFELMLETGAEEESEHPTLLAVVADVRRSVGHAAANQADAIAALAEHVGAARVGAADVRTDRAQGALVVFNRIRVALCRPVIEIVELLAGHRRGQRA